MMIIDTILTKNRRMIRYTFATLHSTLKALWKIQPLVISINVTFA